MNNIYIHVKVVITKVKASEGTLLFMKALYTYIITFTYTSVHESYTHTSLHSPPNDLHMYIMKTI